MRIKISCDVGRGVRLPINYNDKLAGVIYQFLNQSDPEYAFFLHENGYTVEEKHFKLFTFSQLMAKVRKPVEDEQIFFGSMLTWYVSSPKESFLTNFAASLMENGVLQIGTQQFRVLDVEATRTPRFQRQMKFKCLSPIVMSTKREWNGELAAHYCLHDDPEFSELVRRNLVRKYEAIYGRPPKDDSFEMKFDEAYIRKRNGRVTRLIRYKAIDIRGVLCPFFAAGNPELMLAGYECGFGDKNSAGFGMVEVGGEV
jgi:CRISPR-associated endoribonuclease Cas6